MKYIITEDRSKKVAFKLFDAAVGDIRPFEEVIGETRWIGYTNDFCVKNNTFLFGILEDDSDKKPLIVYYWGKAFDMDYLVDVFGQDLARKFLREYIQQYYDEPIEIC
jgi:hypothetical protein